MAWMAAITLLCITRCVVADCLAYVEIRNGRTKDTAVCTTRHPTAYSKIKCKSNIVTQVKERYNQREKDINQLFLFVRLSQSKKIAWVRKTIRFAVFLQTATCCQLATTHWLFSKYALNLRINYTVLWGKYLYNCCQCINSKSTDLDTTRSPKHGILPPNSYFWAEVLCVNGCSHRLGKFLRNIVFPNVRHRLRKK